MKNISQGEEGRIIGLSGHPLDEVHDMLKSIVKSELPVEIFDAFLKEYAETKDLHKARFYAQC